MSELKARVQQVTDQVTNTVEKAVSAQSSRVEAAFGEVDKLQKETLTQAGQWVENLVRLANQQLEFVEQVMGEWRKLVLSATRNAADAFAAKKPE